MSIRPYFIASLLFVVFGCQKAPSVGKLDEQPAATKKAGDPEFAVPDGTPEEILKFVGDLQQRRPKFMNQQQMLEHTFKTQRALMDAGDKILAQPAEDEILADAVRMKLFAMVALAANQTENTAQGKLLAERAVAVVDQLRKDTRQPVADAAKEYWIAARALTLPSLSAPQRTELTEDAIQYMIDTHVSQASVRDASFLADQFAMIGANESSAALCDRIATLLNDAPIEKLKEMASVFRVKSTRLRLVGGKLELSGKRFDGGDFDWESYRGKVVLVDFWATWCRPCLAELPSVEANYAKYHDRGFEIVGISLDHDRKSLEEFLERRPLPWIQMFEEPEAGKNGWSNPMAMKYGVSSIPATFLVDREGKVISMDVRGVELQSQLAKLLATGN